MTQSKLRLTSLFPRLTKQHRNQQAIIQSNQHSHSTCPSSAAPYITSGSRMKGNEREAHIMGVMKRLLLDILHSEQTASYASRARNQLKVILGNQPPVHTYLLKSVTVYGEATSPPLLQKRSQTTPAMSSILEPASVCGRDESRGHVLVLYAAHWAAHTPVDTDVLRRDIYHTKFADVW